MKIRKALFTALMLPHFLMGEIVETSQFEDVLTHVEQSSYKNILIVCDLDNTLFQGSQQLGSVAWGEYIIEQLERKGVSKEHAEQIESMLWQTVQPHLTVKNVDPKTPEVIHEIQKRNISMMGLTARAPNEADYTTHQLLSLNIDLSSNESPAYIAMGKHPALYANGILFSTPFNKKSEVLFNFLSQYSIHPECVIFVDDKRSHVEDLEKACKEKEIPYIGIRFGAADEAFKNFDPLIAQIQWEAFPTILSDEEAQRIANP